MRVTVTVEGEGASAGVLDLKRWLVRQPQLRGRVRQGAAPPSDEGAMGVAEALLVLLAPGGVAAVVAGAVVTWLTSRRGEFTVTLNRPDGSQISVTSARARSAGTAEVAELVRELTAALDAGTPSADGAGHPPDEQ